MPWVASGVFGRSAVENIVVLSSADWVGKPLPIASSISPPISIVNERWDILMFHHSCPKCREAVELCVARVGASPLPRLVLLEVPPYGQDMEESPDVSIAKLDDSHSWFVSTPVMVRVKSGTVVSVPHDFE